MYANVCAAKAKQAPLLACLGVYKHPPCLWNTFCFPLEACLSMNANVHAAEDSWTQLLQSMHENL